MGDSFFATTHEVTGYLEALARSAGVLAEGERYRDYSSLIESALAFPAPGITSQYETAQTESQVRVVLMNGGGADVLLGSCDVVDDQCPLLVDAALALETLLAQMAADGVEEVVFVGYPDPAPADVREKMDALRPLLEQACSESPVPCEWLDLRPTFSENEAAYLEADGLNPTSLGAQVSAAAIWAAMQDACIAQ